MSRANPRYRRSNPALPVIGVNNVFLATYSGVTDGQTWDFCVAYMGADTLVNTSEVNIAASIETSVTAALTAVLDSTSKWLSVKVQCLNVPTRISTTRMVNGGLGWSGTNGATHIPLEMAVVMSKYTNTKGQHGRGRNYFPAVPSSFVTPGTDANRLNAAGFAAYDTLATALDAATIVDAATVMDICIYTRPPKGLPVTNAQLASVLVIRTLLGTVRRRRPGRGK